MEQTGPQDEWKRITKMKYTVNITYETISFDVEADNEDEALYLVMGECFEPMIENIEITNPIAEE